MGHDFDCFGRLVFDDRVMKATLSGEVYQKLRRTIDEGSEPEPAVADAVAARATKNLPRSTQKCSAADFLSPIVRGNGRANSPRYSRVRPCGADGR